MRPFTLLIKPSGSDCNLNCTYCFYKDRAPELGSGKQRMSEPVLEKLICDYMKLNFPLAVFSWQGGEPTLMGLDFYRRVIELQQQNRSPNQQVTNLFQTNAVLLDDKWCKFLHENTFLVGISLDGPKELHDHYRVDHSGRGTFDRVLKAINTCKQHKVEFNILCLLNNINVQQPGELFDFFIARHIKYLQFIPCLEADLSGTKPADFSATAEQYGHFLCKLFDRWYDYGPEKLSIRVFDSILAHCINGRHTLCSFDKRCSQYIVIEHTGDAFCCDFFVEQKWFLGNICQTPIDQLAASDLKQTFAKSKLKLADKCLLCTHLDICRGGCLKNRSFLTGRFDQPSYYCQSYKRFFEYVMPRFMQLAAKINATQL